MIELTTPHGTLPIPVFFPDATRAAVKSVDSTDLEAVGVQELVVNVFHLLTHPERGFSPPRAGFTVS